MPVVSVHAPTLLLTQRVWGPEAWSKVDNSIGMAKALGADTVVLYPPFRWQKGVRLGVRRRPGPA
jgi:sugar phosphate isomerase/epimerase